MQMRAPENGIGDGALPCLPPPPNGSDEGKKQPAADGAVKDDQGHDNDPCRLRVQIPYTG